MTAILLDKKHFLFDIETSGLNKQTDHIVCIGISFINDNNEIESKQWSLQLPEEEKNLLKHFLGFITSFSHAYTYGGKLFDWPFLLNRCLYYELDITLLQKIHVIDMKKHLHYLGATRTLLENALNIVRQFTTSGKSLVKVYHTYKSCGERIYLSLILGHNQDELRTLLGFYELYQTLYQLQYFKCIEIKQSANTLDFIIAVPYAFITDFEGHYKHITLNWKSNAQQLKIQVAFSYLALKQYLTPHKDYYYIPSQNQLMHRSLAHFIPACDKRKVNKEECAVIKESTYVPLFTTHKLTLPIWYDISHMPYLSIEDFSFSILANQLFALFFSSIHNKKHAS